MSVTGHYSPLDRLLHRIAFAAPAVQLSAADMERALHGSRFRDVVIEKPIFVTSLPRAGTTLMLETLAGLPGVATHCYRDMPFVMAPYLWEQLSKPFRKTATRQQRAHGDGMQVGFDSPEAFEEVIWKAFFPRKYASDRIELWNEDEDARDVQAFWTSHMRSLIAIRAGAAGRYISKNNANIARVRFIKRLFPDGLIVVPIREPVAQAVSLLAQHTRFLELHGTDPFARRYMEDIGHLEFGQLHRPIAFPGMNEVRAAHRPDRLDYWVAYWLQAFHFLEAQRDDLLFVSYERLCGGGTDAVETVARRLGLDGRADAAHTPTEFWTPRSYDKEAGSVDPRLLEEARRLHARLLALSPV